MSISLVPNPIPPFQGPSGGDVASGFLNAFFGAQQNMRQNQQMQMQQENNAFQQSLRPLHVQGMQLGLQSKQLGLQQQKQSMEFAGQDQQRQNEQADYQKQILRPLQEASMRNGLVTQAYGIEQSRQTLDANSAMMGAQLDASRAIEQSMTNLSGFGQALKSAPPETPTYGRVTSYGYANDPHGDNNSASRIGAYDNTLDENSLAVSPDIERQMKSSGIKMGDTVHLRLANGQVVTRRLADRTMQDQDTLDKAGNIIAKGAISTFGKPLTGRFDFFSPDGVHAADGHQVQSFTKASGAAPVQGMEAGPVRPEQVTNALNSYDALVRNAQLLPPNSPARTRAEVAIMTAQADPTFSGLLRMRDVQVKNQQLGNQIAADIIATPAPAQDLFKAQFPQFANLKVVKNPDQTYDVVRNVGGKPVPLDPNEKAAFAQAYQGFVKDYKPVLPGSIPTGVLTNYAKAVQIAHAADDLDPANVSDTANKVRTQAAGARAAIMAYEAINPTLKLYAAARTSQTPTAPDNTVGLPSQQNQNKLKDLPTPEQEQARVNGATKEEKLNKAADVVAPRLQTFAPDNGKDSLTLNPALTLARKIHQGLTHEGKRTPGFLDYFAAAASGEGGDLQFDAMDKTTALQHALEHNDLKPDEYAIDGVTNAEAARVWAQRILTKYDYNLAKPAVAPANADESAKKAAGIKAAIDGTPAGK